ncbi:MULTISPECIES: hypothetical protein [unclassified Brevundimonas]|nr:MULTISPECIES: hypothetical protein [unclassified Brevundimonas]
MSSSTLARAVLPQRAEGYWLDIGRPPDCDCANAEFGAVFGG